MSEGEEAHGGNGENADSSLTTEQNENIQHLQEISGSLDRTAARSLLEECSWDLERAVNKALGLPDPLEELPHVRRRGNARTENPLPSVNLVPPNQRVLRVADSQPRGWWWALLLLFEPFRLTYHFLFSVARFFTSFLWPDPRNQVTDPVGDVQRFITYFKSNYVNNGKFRSTEGAFPSTSRPDFPPFYEGSYAQALQEAKRSLRFLVVYLHGDSHEDTRTFCEKTLLDSDVIRFLDNREQIVFWGCNIKSPEGYRVSRTLREHTYPFIGVIGLTSLTVPEFGHFANSTIGMALLGRIEGAVQPIDLIQQLTSIFEEHQGATIAARLDRREREAAARIREEQDLAYKQSLERDRAKLAAREEEQRNAALEAAEQARLRRRQDALKRARANRRTRWRVCLPPEPEQNSPSTVQLSVKLPNGRRVHRTFRVNDSVKILYYFILSHDDAPENFEIQANFPKRLLPCQPEQESDLEDYIDEEGESPADTGCPASTAQHSISADTKTGGLNVVSDWSPHSPTDPPTFLQLGLSKPEVLFVIDKDA
ncbi:hypothetical protein CRM22_009913 [Opisthorchis felineus]|uniref:UBX domain-containing protein n=1 Tax=Opisthorchis felineus TaxID=147828 RepID=A0A4V3SCN6_OPIFE|nr:hypothetical protein CRM22_009913 [Opisthorchis felineus]